jgi:hypothetical protein
MLSPFQETSFPDFADFSDRRSSFHVRHIYLVFDGVHNRHRTFGYIYTTKLVAERLLEVRIAHCPALPCDMNQPPPPPPPPPPQATETLRFMGQQLEFLEDLDQRPFQLRQNGLLPLS